MHLLLGRESARVDKGLAQGHSATANSAQPEIAPAISRLQAARATTEPRRPTEVKIVWMYMSFTM